MAIHFYTADPKALLAAFNARIAQKEPKGKITTWERSDDGIYYTHKAAEWKGRAWLKPAIGNQKLTFNVIKPQNMNITSTVYAYYHGHLIETFLNHFDQAFSSAAATALPESPDLVQ